MRNYFTLFVVVTFCVLAIFFNSCSSSSEDDNPIPKNTFVVNGVQYSAAHMGYIENDDLTITLYFGDAEYDKASKSICITVSANSPQEGHYFYGNSSTTNNVMHSALYKTIEGDKITEYTNITKGTITMIKFDYHYIVNYELTIGGYIISGHHMGIFSLIDL